VYRSRYHHALPPVHYLQFVCDTLAQDVLQRVQQAGLDGLHKSGDDASDDMTIRQFLIDAFLACDK
jgi:hypothetical protein